MRHQWRGAACRSPSARPRRRPPTAGPGPPEVWPPSGAAEGGEPAPYPTRPPEATQVRIFTAPDVAGLIDLVEGALVADQDPPATSGPPLRILIGGGLVRV